MKQTPLKRKTPLRAKAATKAPARRKCKNPDCREWFRPFNSLQVACSPRCALEHGRAERKRAEKRETRKLREKLKTRGQHMREAQQAFNAWVRLRDADKPCISCGRHVVGGDSRGGQWDCGHYRSRGASPELRFEPLNAHKQCKRCNRDKSGNVVEYRISLRARIGDKALAWLEGPHEPKKWTITELEEIKRMYRAEARQIERKRAEQA